MEHLYRDVQMLSRKLNDEDHDHMMDVEEKTIL